MHLICKLSSSLTGDKKGNPGSLSILQIFISIFNYSYYFDIIFVPYVCQASFIIIIVFMIDILQYSICFSFFLLYEGHTHIKIHFLMKLQHANMEQSHRVCRKYQMTVFYSLIFMTLIDNNNTFAETCLNHRKIFRE